MTLDDACNFFESLHTETTKKNEIKIYKKFLDILTKLKSRELSKDEIHSIEAELDRLNLESNPENSIKYFKKSLRTFEKYLKDTLFLTSKSYYTSLYGGLGMSFGILFGVVFLSSWERSLGISLGIIAGWFIGLTIGQSLDAKAMSEGRVL